MPAAARAVWKGFLKFGSVACAVKLINAVSESEKIHFRILNRQDRLPVKSAYLDEETGKAVEAADQVKGYALDDGAFILLEPEEIKALKSTSDHTLDLGETVPLDAIDQRYLDKAYYVVPADPGAAEPFAVVREALAVRKMAARSCIVLYQKGREVVLRPHGKGLLMTTLRNHGEMVAEKSFFAGMKATWIDPDMIEIAELLIGKKTGKFDPRRFEDAYENALIAMIAAKRAGKAPPKPVAPPKPNVVSLAEVLRNSLAKEGIAGKATKAKAAPARKPRNKAA